MSLQLTNIKEIINRAISRNFEKSSMINIKNDHLRTGSIVMSILIFLLEKKSKNDLTLSNSNVNNLEHRVQFYFNHLFYR